VIRIAASFLMGRRADKDDPPSSQGKDFRAGAGRVVLTIE
jgi:hypothetical protein